MDDASDASFARACQDLGFGPEAIGPGVTPGRYDRRHDQIERIVLVITGVLLLTAVLAQASTALDSNPAAASAAAWPADPDDLVTQIAAQVAPLLPAATRMKSVTLQFTPPKGATLLGVAPGLSQIRSRFFLVQLQVQGRTMAYGATVDAERQVMVAARNVAAGEPVGDHDVVMRWVDAFGGDPGALQELPTDRQYVAATMLRAGEPIYPSGLTRAIAVHPGDMVSVVVRNGDITVRAQLEARSAAAVGETITMINPSSDTPVTVNVTGPKTAELVIQ